MHLCAPTQACALVFGGVSHSAYLGDLSEVDECEVFPLNFEERAMLNFFTHDTKSCDL